MRWIGRKPRVRRQRGTGRFGTTAAILAVVMVLSTIWLAERALREEVPVARVIVLHAFSGLDDTLNDGLIPAFKEEWKARTGESLFFVTEYAGSRVIAGGDGCATGGATSTGSDRGAGTLGGVATDTRAVSCPFCSNSRQSNDCPGCIS